MENGKEQTTIRIPVELKKKLQQEADLKKARQTTLRLETKLYNELKIIARQSGLTVSSLLIIAIWQKVLKHNSL